MKCSGFGPVRRSGYLDGVLVIGDVHHVRLRVFRVAQRTIGKVRLQGAGMGLEALYGLSYTLKFGVKLGKYGKQTYDYPVMALEGLWWMDDMREFSAARKDDWKWTMMIMQPDIITPDLVELARADLIKKKNLVAAAQLRFEVYHEGPSAQIMYFGPYADEGPTIQRLHAFIIESGHQLRGKHHEIYLSDPRRTAPEKLKTVIRQPM